MTSVFWRISMKMRNAVSLISSLVVTVLGVAALVAVSVASAQTTTKGSIEGTAVDATGAPGPGVTVTVSSAGGGGASTTTNDEGLFRLPNLQPGKYTVTVEGAQGFASFEQPNVEVNLSRTTNLTLQLRPAGAGDTVAVTQESATATSPTAKVSSNTNGGLYTVTFDTSQGQIRVNLPDDMRAGDTISGTLVAEPKGQTEAEREKSLEALRRHFVVIRPQSKTPSAEDAGRAVRAAISSANEPFTVKLPPPGYDQSLIAVSLLNPPNTLQTFTVPLGWVNAPSTPPDPNQPLRPQSRGELTAGSEFITGTLKDVIAQQGRYCAIRGPFDGDASNTTLRFIPPGGNLQDFEKGAENVSGGFGLVRPLAESPRKIVFVSPVDLTGLADLVLKERDIVARRPYRSVGVRLSAPKLNLLRGERTTLTVEVSGLEGIKENVPLQLDSKGVITMDGGNFQNLRIKPSEVTRDGRYTTNRAITGVQAGGFTVTATVIVTRFDFVLQDDTDPNRIFHFNSFTGDYIFACGGGSCRGGSNTGGTQTGGTQTGGTQTGGTQTGTGTPVVPPVGGSFTLPGNGKPAMKGCIITLSHNAPDRRVFARLDACTKTGDASVETTSPKTNFNITDKNTADNTAPSPPPK
jgi:hypothetical protein